MSTLNISYSSLLRVIVVFLAIAFLYVIRDIILILFLSMILSSAFEPWVNWFERRHLPRGFGVVAIYLGLFIIISVIGISLAPAISSQGKILANNLPNYYDQIIEKLTSKTGAGQSAISQDVETFTNSVGTLLGNVIPAVRGVFGGGFTIFLILVLTFYLSVEDRGLKRFFHSTLPDKYQPYFARIINKVQQKMGMWLRGQLLLSLVIFLITTVSLFFIHSVTQDVPYWLVLGLIAGLFEVVPFVGPFIAGSVAVLLVIGNSFWLAVVIVLLYLVIQQLENHILVPKIMQKTVGLNPIVVILVIVIGGRLAGIIGALIAIPVAAAVQVFFKDVMGGEDQNSPARQSAGASRRLAGGKF